MIAGPLPIRSLLSRVLLPLLLASTGVSQAQPGPPAPPPTSSIPAEEPPPETAPTMPVEANNASTETEAPAEEGTTSDRGFDAAWETRKGARILNLTIPPPRGQIVDRNGMPIAQNKVAWYLGINFPLMEGATDTEILDYARGKVEEASRLLNQPFRLDETRVAGHYEERRWLPMIISSVLTPDQMTAIRKAESPGFVLHPTYQRYYPHGKMASHVIGYVGKRGPWPKGEIPNGEDMWPTATGVQGLEATFNEQLTGSPGEIQIIFNERGERVEETLIRAPVPGNNVVTSIDIDMQKMAEKHLADGARRGAFVIMDVQSGDVVAMASWPSYDPNDFIPRISSAKFNELRLDEANPLYGRAFQAAYPPASTFKIPAALGMLESGTIDASTTYSCPTAYTIGDRVFHNWNKDPEGSMNVVGAITRSCNTFFYQAGLATGSMHITSMARRFGLGQKTGVPLQEEVAGFMPTNEWHLQEYGYPILDGDLANIVIGQGQVLTTPLQVTQMMAAIGNRQYLVEARLVLQIQDFNNGIVEAYDVSERSLNVSQYSLSVVHQGMDDVVNSGRGTARRARHEEVMVSGKTGTGQWKPNQKQNIAWFAGFAPAEFPVYAFSAIYEGEPGENVGGGKNAAPIIGSFFEEYLTKSKIAKLEKKSEELKIAMGDLVEEIPEIEAKSIFQSPATAERYESATPAPEAEPAQKKKKGLFQKLFGS